MEPLPFDSASEVLGQPFAAEDLGLSTTPLLAIEFDGSSSTDLSLDAAVRFADWIRATPAVIVGVVDASSPPEFDAAVRACDVIVGPHDHPRLPTACVESGRTALAVTDSLATLEQAVHRHPHAAVTAVQLLRLSHAARQIDALTAESLAYSTLQSGPEFSAWLKAQGGRESAAGHTRQPRTPDAPLVVSERVGQSLSITLSDPARHNAFGAKMRDQLIEALRVGATDPELSEVVLRGAGPSFCSGGDLAEFGSTPDPATAHRIRMTRSAAQWIIRCGDRMRVEVQGHVIGAGVELAAFAPSVSARQDSSFALPEIAMGLIPGAGGTVSVTRRIGRHRAAWMALTGAAIDARTALRWGLIDTITAPPSETGRS